MSDAAAATPSISYGGRLTVLATERPDDLAVAALDLDGAETSLTWRAFDARANQIGRAVAERSVGPGDRVALALPNSCDAIAAVFACWKLGAVPIPVRWDLPDWERDRILEVVDATLVIGTDDLGWLAASTSLDDATLDGPVSPHTHGICSSGSTGTPKLILMENPAVWTAEIGKPFVEGWKDVPRPQTVLMATTLYHTNGFATMLNLLAGDTLVTLEKFDAGRIVDLVERHRVSTITMTPTMLQRVADLPGVDDRDLSSLEWVLQGAAVIPPSLVHRIIDLIGAERFFMAYGMTEGLGLTALRADEWLTHQGSVGQGYRGTEVRIADASGQPLPPGEIGEIYLRSPMSGMYRYVGGAAPLPTTDDGFSTAGDMGWLDDDGFLYIADRRVDMIITGGANVFPAEVESALIEHPQIVDVVVVGLSDPEWGRRVHAIVEPKDPSSPPDATDVIAFAKGRLAGYKVPKTVEIVERIPRSASTKISRAALIEERGG